jgi:hypothetical protein
MSTKWASHYRDNILKLLPADGSRLRAKEIYRKTPFTSVTTKKYLGILTKEGSIQRIQESQKTVYYRRCEDVRLRHLINEFTKEVETSLVQLSTKEREANLKRIYANLPMPELNELLNDEAQLKSWVLCTVIRKIHTMIRTTLFPTLPNLEFYVGVIGGTVKIIPKQPSYDWSHAWEA